jgi:hypothetical protein
MGLHPDSSELAIFDMFTQYGSVILSPRFNLMKQSYKEIIEHKDSQIIKLKEHIDELLKVKYDYEKYRNEIDAQKRTSSNKGKSSKQKGEISQNSQDMLSANADLKEKIEQYEKQLENKNLEINSLQSLILKVQEQVSTSGYNAHQSKSDTTKQSEGFSFNIFQGLLIGIILIAIFSVFIIIYSSRPVSDQINRDYSFRNNKPSQKTPPSTSLQNKIIEDNTAQFGYKDDDYIWFSQDGKKGFLKIDAFLVEMTKHNNGVKDYDEFIELLVSYLFNSENIKNAYASDSSNLADFIKKNNVKSSGLIKKFIEFNLKKYPKLQKVEFNKTPYWAKAIGGSDDPNEASLIVIQR